MRSLSFLAAMIVALVFSAIVSLSHASDASGSDARTPSKRSPGGFNNYCETWVVDVDRVRKLFGACVGS